MINGIDWQTISAQNIYIVVYNDVLLNSNLTHS